MLAKHHAYHAGSDPFLSCWSSFSVLVIPLELESPCNHKTYPFFLVFQKKVFHSTAFFLSLFYFNHTLYFLYVFLWLHVMRVVFLIVCVSWNTILFSLVQIPKLNKHTFFICTCVCVRTPIFASILAPLMWQISPQHAFHPGLVVYCDPEGAMLACLFFKR